ncbi:hypothetical protein SS50377_26897 [Spironucleus salmonicida]|uniref:Uncharacterized protein n=1 Tax=Spironucleus salmonicida TaxID=348837 RepID=V6LT24_9EUKA|nr:hypothetical protein SS50377_26897 [Spironucleus salmonicida]|eukprot:EST47408.1 Hypothetical protein SS50377_12394 [Spironucleus salmonicida]
MAFNFGGAAAKPTTGFSFGGTAPSTIQQPTSAFGTTQPATTFGSAQPTTTFGTFGAQKPATAGFGNFGASATTVNSSLPQPITLSQQDLYLAPEEHVKRLSQELEMQATQFSEISAGILQQDQRNYEIYNQLETFSLLLDKLTSKQENQRQEIAKIASVQQQLYQDLNQKPKNPNAKISQVARLMVEVESQIEAVSAGSVNILRDIQEQATVLENLKTIK